MRGSMVCFLLVGSLSLSATSCNRSVVTTTSPGCDWDSVGENVTVYDSGWSDYAQAVKDHSELPEAIDGSADGWHPKGGNFNLYVTSTAPLGIRGVHLEVLSGAVPAGGYVTLWGEADGEGEWVIGGTMEAPSPIKTGDIIFPAELAENLNLWNHKAMRLLILAPDGTDPVIKVSPLCGNP